MKANYTHISILLDRSGSMRSIIEDMKGGLQEFLDKQKALPGDITVSVAMFDDVYTNLTSFTNLKAEELDLSQYYARNSTALNDSAMKMIHETGEVLAKMKEEDRPEKVLMVIITDGRENASKEYSSSDLKAKITEQETKWRWQFAYLGANQDSYAVGGGVGISKDKVANFAADSVGVKAMYNKLNNSSIKYRGVGGASASFSLDEDE